MLKKSYKKGCKIKNEKMHSNSIKINLFWKIAERILSQLVAFIVSIILARLLSPKDYGAISIVVVFITIADTLVISGFGNALIQKKDADNIDFSSVFFFSIVFSTILYIVLYIIAPYIAQYYKLEILDPVLKVLGLRIILSGINSVQQAYVSKNMMFKIFFWSTIIGTSISGIIGIYLAYDGFGVWALVFQQMINSVVNTLVLWLKVRWRPENVFSLTRIKILFKYGWKILFEGLSATIIGQLRNLIIGKVYMSEDLGYYTKSQQFPGLLVDNISSSLSSVLFPAMSLKQDEKEQVIRLLRKSVIISTYILFPMLTGLAVVSKPLIVLLLTEKWIESVPYMRIFCFTYGITIGMIPRHQALNATGRSDVFMYEHILGRIVGLVILFNVYRISVMAIALSGITSSIILSIIIMYTSKRFNHYAYKDQILDILPVIGLCISMSLPTYFILFFNLSNLLTIFLQIIVGICIYVVLSIKFKPKGYIMLLEYVIPILNKFRGNINV